MTTSGTVSFSVSRDDIIKQAMFDAGALGIGETASDDDLQFCATKLNLMVKQWMGTIDFAPGLKEWSRKNGNLFLSTTTATYSLGPDAVAVGSSNSNGWASSFTTTTLTASSSSFTFVVASNAGGLGTGDFMGVQMADGSLLWGVVLTVVGLTITLNIVNSKTANNGATVYMYLATNKARRPLKILTAVLRDSNANDVPLLVFNLQDYEALPSKTNVQNTGDPISIFYQANLTNGTLKTDVAAAADTSKYIHMVYLSPIEDFNSATDTPDYPQEWYRALIAGLAVDICPGFSLPVTQELKDMKAEALATAGRSNPETSSAFFMPKDDDYARWGNW